MRLYDRPALPRQRGARRSPNRHRLANAAAYLLAISLIAAYVVGLVLVATAH